jgi:hypothetical protein
MSEQAKRIPLDRRVCVVREGRIDLRPERGAVVGPAIGLVVGAILFASIVMFAEELPLWVLAVMLLGAVVITPLSAMGFVYSFIGAAVVVEKSKQSVRFQQGVMGLGIGTYELVPFWKIKQIEVEDYSLGEVAPGRIRPPLDLRAWDITLVKESGKRLPIGQVISGNTNDLIDEAFDRALDAAEAIGAMVEKPVVVTAEVEPAPEAEPTPETEAQAAKEAAAHESGPLTDAR